jgi:hypothetical protein
MSEKTVKCSCGGLMKFSRTIDFKIGATDSDLIPLLELPKVSEGILPLDIYVCPNCGRIEFFASKEIKDSLLRLAK